MALSDVQDLVATHLNTPWPINAAGVPLHTAAELDSDTLRLLFVGGTSG